MPCFHDAESHADNKSTQGLCVSEAESSLHSELESHSQAFPCDCHVIICLQHLKASLKAVKGGSAQVLCCGAPAAVKQHWKYLVCVPGVRFPKSA